MPRREKQLRDVDRREVDDLVRCDRALKLKQFCLGAGLGYRAGLELSRLPGFPLIRGRVYWSDFVIWRRSQFALPTTASSTTRQQLTEVTNDRLKAHGKSTWPLRARKLLEAQ
jgi:hypothetical protein